MTFVRVDIHGLLQLPARRGDHRRPHLLHARRAQPGPADDGPAPARDAAHGHPRQRCAAPRVCARPANGAQGCCATYCGRTRTRACPAGRRTTAGRRSRSARTSSSASSPSSTWTLSAARTRCAPAPAPTCTGVLTGRARAGRRGRVRVLRSPLARHALLRAELLRRIRQRGRDHERRRVAPVLVPGASARAARARPGADRAQILKPAAKKPKDIWGQGARGKGTPIKRK
jgi:hypothetical protein